MKILGTDFSYNKNFEQNKNFCEHIVKIGNILKLSNMRLLTLGGRITVFKSLAVSKILFGKEKTEKLNTVLLAMAMKWVV